MEIKSAWPNKSQLLVLRAALLPPEQAEPYWQMLIDSYDLEKLDHGCNQLLPMVFINLKDRMSKDINEKICRSSYKFVWANNHLLMHDAKSLLNLLKMHDVDVCLLKGAAFIGHYYADYGMRILGDIDLLVLPNEMSALVKILESNHYQFKSNDAGIDSRNLIKIDHAISLVNHRGTDFDVHQYLSPFLVDAKFSERLWKNKKLIDLFGNEEFTYVLSPTYQFLHTILHGLQYAPESSIRWVVDAVNLLKNSDVDIDWNELIDVCHKHHLNLPVSQALHFLSVEIGVVIPDNITLYFSNLEITKRDKKYYARSSDLGFQGTIERINVSWEHYKAHALCNTKKFNVLNFYRFLLIYLEIKSSWMLLPHLVTNSLVVIFRSINQLFK